MGQKVNPHGLRVGIIRNWDSRWFVRDDQFGDLVVEDDKIRKFVKKKIASAGVPKIEIERNGGRVKVFVHCARPGAVIGKGGTEIEKLRQSIEKLIKKPVALTIVEEKRQDLNAQLVAERIALDLEKRISFRRATRSAIDRAMKAGAKGIKTNVAGRLGGAEIARSCIGNLPCNNGKEPRREGLPWTTKSNSADACSRSACSSRWCWRRIS